MIVSVLVVVGLSQTPVGVHAANVKINSDAPGTVQNEVRVTRNATDGNNLVVAYNDSIGAASSPLGISLTLDGGATWADRQLAVPIHPLVGSPDDGLPMPYIFDPYIDSDSQGNIYAGYIAAIGGPGGPSGLYIERSQTKGQVWSGPTTIAFDVRAAVPPPPPPDPYRFNDRPDMTVDGSDNVYVVWIKDVGQAQPTSDIYFAKSPPPGTPGPGNPTGLDFSGTVANSVAPKTINDGPNGTDWANVPDIAVASNGTVYVAWINVDVTVAGPKPGTLLIDTSSDGGATFGADTAFQSITALARNVTTATGATDVTSGSYPSLAADPTNPQRVYVAYAADPPGADEANIFFLRSSDGGATWTTPVVINDDGTTNDQIHPSIAVKPDGTIDVAWYDKRNAPGDDQWDVYIAKSTDNGTSFSANVRVSDQSFAPPTDVFGRPWLGEYLGLELDGSWAYIAFTSSVNDTRGDLFFDTRANPAIPVELVRFAVE
jgi:hypothetical protein